MTTEGQAPEGQPSRVLLVEDDLVTAHLIQHLLEDTGSYRVTLAQDGIRGSQLVRDGEWDLVMSDINLPGVDGLEVMKASKKASPDTPVLATTGHTSPGYAEQAFRSGADDLILKPLKRTDLLEKVFVLVSRKRRKQESHAPTVLAIGLTPGDAEAGCGGILLKHRDQGFRVVILTITGDRSEQSVAAAEVVGSIGVSGGLTMPPPPTEEELVTVVRVVVEELRPVTIYIPSPHDTDESAQQCYRATISVASQIPNFYCYQTLTSTLAFHPSIFVNIAQQLDTKLEALACFDPRGWEGPYPDADRTRATAIYWGRHLDHGQVEPLERVRGSRDGPTHIGVAATKEEAR